MKKQGGPLQRVNVRMTKEDGEALKKSNDATGALLASIGSSTSSSSSSSSAKEMEMKYRPRMSEKV